MPLSYEVLNHLCLICLLLMAWLLCTVKPALTVTSVKRSPAHNSQFLALYFFHYIMNLSYMWTSRREDKFSSFFRSSPDLQHPPKFSWLLHVHIPNVQFAPCAFRPSKMHLERHISGLLNHLHRAEVVDSHFKLCFNNFIYQPGLIISHFVAHYLNICYASTVNFKKYIF